ncbi:2-succinyl-6-hydroxy-2,4-cyclohexadiene-1-carboxylate synthase [Photobacterium sp. 1_MG-2023]|uniref:2-succinyl-6-hydroxy-2, 4-cyclohexadiene-1-carboxylate synthase n=1 Tax=Photobacterium sp. 1_MG-2023 TaxID=3062646 RepID=UPI0026E24FEE|nr:2-succinyl-6-hydroxy-2,4-cyclohexadiene-1-carboxylate synthase [Photobacterium sp. 1_MG-2023]MDO6707196.1 2-succinyl-6-hydroxy-2,4-cyclohexadiene-1-carboxylate synthase [Photobacterium sp. 1_MG-2023]
MLFSRTLSVHEGTTRPVLVFLHGLLGSGEDWRTCVRSLSDFRCIALDLPGHGQSVAVDCDSLDQAATQVADTLSARLPPGQPLVLVGYSLGGRIAMHGLAAGLFGPLPIQQLVIEGGHVGLASASEKQQRWRHDARWARRFRREPLSDVLQDWYQQPVFASLDPTQRQHMADIRRQNDGAAVARMLLATSLARQEPLRQALHIQPVPVHYICGARDRKFSRLAFETAFPVTQIAGAGHNTHQARPAAFARTVAQLAGLQNISDSMTAERL